LLRTKSGITKVYFSELPKDVQNVSLRFCDATGKASRNASTSESTNHATPFRFRLPIGLRALSKKSSTSENRYYRKHTPAAELMVIREINFHKAFLLGPIIAIVLFAVVWARFKITAIREQSSK